MKRKFSFSLAPIKTGNPEQEAQEKQTRQPTPSQAQPSSQSYSHRRSQSGESLYESSPWCTRRVLDAQTEYELRAACRLILKNFKPSDYGMENTDPKLDFGGIQGWKEFKEPKAQPAEVKVRMPTGAPADLKGAYPARKSSNKTRTRAKADNEIRARTQGESAVRANMSQKRADFGWLDDRDDKREQNLKKFGRGPSIEMPRSATLKTKGDSGVSTPVTVTSTLAYKRSVSTGPASATLPLGRNGSHGSRRPSQPENFVVVEAMNSRVRPSTSARPPSRSDSIKKGIKNYVFSGSRSRTLSRQHSQDSLRTTNTVTSQTSSQDLQRSGSASGWRNWMRPRSRSTSRPGTAQGEEPEPPKKPEISVVDLNRELPPLPSLDTWKEPSQPKEESGKSPVSPHSNPHIATLMRPNEHTPERSSAPRIHHKSDSDSLALQYAQSHPVRKPSRREPGSFSFPDPKRSHPYSPIVIDPASTGSSSTSNLEHRFDMGSSTHTRQRSGDSLTSPSSPMGEINPEGALNYSRKISTDTPSRGAVFINEVSISKKEEQKSKLKKVFSGWMNKKAKKDDWMQKIEKGGVKEGVMVQESNTATTVVRY